MPDEQQHRSLIRLPKVKARTGKSRAAIYEAMAKPEDDPDKFPDSVPIGPRAVAWVEDEVDDWVARQIARRDEGTGPQRSLGLIQHHRKLRAQRARRQREANDAS